jgi:16S rRNA U516 pseudouridylate synthase RsuA-like enzyme
MDGDQRAALDAGIPLDEGLATLFHLRQMTEIEQQRLVDLLDPTPGPLHWYRATLRQGWKRQLRRMFAAVGAPIDRLVRVRIGPVRIDGLRGGRTRSLKAPEVRGLGSGAGRSRDTAPKEAPGEAPAARGAGSRRPATRPGRPRPGPR